MDTDALKAFEMIQFGGIVGAITVLAFTWIFGRLIREGTDRLADVFAAQRLLFNQISAFLRFGVYVVGTFLALRSMFAVSTEVLTLIGGTVAVSLGLALKDQAASLVAGIMILVEKPFQVGDRVSFGGFYGEIRNIGLRSVTLITLDDNEVTIPNSKFLTDPVACGNSGALTMLIQQDFYVGVDQDVPRAKSIVEEALTSSCYFYPDLPWTVLVNQVQLENMIAVRLRAKAYVLELRYEKAFESDVAQRVLEAFQAERILPPAVLHRPSMLPEEPKALEA